VLVIASECCKVMHYRDADVIPGRTLGSVASWTAAADLCAPVWSLNKAAVEPARTSPGQTDACTPSS